MKLRQCKIKDLGIILTGNTPPTSKREYYGNLYPLIKATDMKADSRYIGETEEKLSDKGYQLFQSRLLPKNTTCVVTIGTIGKLCLTKEPCFCNQAINSIIVDKNFFDSIYIFYLMKISIPKVKFLSSGTASGRENVSKTAFENIELKVHELQAQQKIASILSAYDDLIENNTRRIKILEEMAQNLYYEWFVKFRFPGWQQVKMVESELGLIPEGWGVRKLEQLGLLARGKSKHRPRNDPSLYGGKYPFIQTGEVKEANLFVTNYSQTYNETGLAQSKLWEANTLLITIAANIAETAIITFQACFPDSIVGFVADSSKVSVEFIKYSIENIKLRMQNVSKGTTQDNLSLEKIRIFDFLLPDKEIMRLFTEITSPIFSQIKNLLLKNQNLRQTRDLLLPKLISGEIDVKNIDAEQIVA